MRIPLAPLAVTYGVLAGLIAPATLLADAPQSQAPAQPSTTKTSPSQPNASPPAPAKPAPQPTSTTAADPAAQEQAKAQLRGARDRARPATADERPVAFSASPGSVIIKDFSFGPAAITVNVGDSVTWRNNGPTGHSATARDGSFDTGVLPKGQSASHTFTQAGTFAYICKPHPFMHGTVRVVAAGGGGSGGGGASASGAGGSGSSGSGGSSSSGEGGSSSASGSGDNGPTLANTGQDAWAVAALGFLLLGLGAAIQRRTSPE